MEKRNIIRQNDRGFALVSAMFFLVVLAILGAAATRNTSIELQISGNDKVTKESFYHAESGLEAGIQLIEENLNCAPDGFKTNVNLADGTRSAVINGLDVIDTNFWATIKAPSTIEDKYPSDEYVLSGKNATEKNPYRDVTFPPRDPKVIGSQSQAIHTNLVIYGGKTSIGAGSNIAIASCYDGSANCVGDGASYILYSIHSQHQGRSDSESIVKLDWKHMIGKEGDCKYGRIQ